FVLVFFFLCLLPFSACRWCGSRNRRRPGRGFRWFFGFVFGFGRRFGSSIADDRDNGVDLDGLSFLDQNVLKNAGGRRGNLGIYFVGGNLKERLVALDFVALFLEPLRDRTLKNALPH